MFLYLLIHALVAAPGSSQPIGPHPHSVQSGCVNYPALGEMCSQPAAQPRRHRRDPADIRRELYRAGNGWTRVYSTRKVA